MLNLILKEENTYKNGKKEIIYNIEYNGNIVGIIDGGSKSVYQNGDFIFLDEMEYSCKIANNYNRNRYSSLAAAKYAFEKEWKEQGSPVDEQKKIAK